MRVLGHRTENCCRHLSEGRSRSVRLRGVSPFESTGKWGLVRETLREAERNMGEDKGGGWRWGINPKFK